ncbi:hypothetical protein SCYAM73S_03921 [Streptomyces cyaneofuscatus]
MLLASTCGPSSFSTASASSAESVTRTAAASGSCSAWLIRSAATCTGSAVASARIAISVGPCLGVDADRPLKKRLAAATQMLPGPVTRLAGGQSSVPYANIATAWAPPAAYTSSTPSRAQAARIVGCGSPPKSSCAGEATAMPSTPASWAGTTFMTTEDG